jgi:integrase-like protein
VVCSVVSFDRCSCGLPGTESRPVAPGRTAFTQGSFAPEALPSFSATMSPCADPRASHLPFGHWPYRRCPRCLRHPQLVAGTVPTLLCPSVLKCHVPYAGGSSSAPDQFFPDDIGLHRFHRGSALRKSPTNGFPWDAKFQRGRHSVMLWPSKLLALLTVRHRMRHPRTLYIRAYRRFVTSSTVEYATRPTGRLPGLVFHQQEGQPVSAAHGIYGEGFNRRVAGLGLEQVVIAAHSPWQNGYAERFIGSLRRECLDHVIALDERQLLRIVRSYVAYYNKSRTHLSLGKDPPEPRAVQAADAGEIVAIREVGGLHHRYEHRMAA